MPAIVNIAANLVLGSSLVLVVRSSAALRESFVNWYLVLLLAFEAVVFTPIATFLFRFYPHWSLLYAFDPQIFPTLDRFHGWLSLVAVLLNFGAVMLGYSVTRWGWRRHQTWAWPLPLGTGCLALVYLIVRYWDRLFLIGDYDAFWQGNGRIVFASLAGWLGLAAYAGQIGFVCWARKHFRDHDPEPLG